MRPVLGFHLELVSDSTACDDAAWLKSRLEEWIRGWYDRRAAPLPLDRPLGDVGVLPSGHYIGMVEESPLPDSRLLEILWQYPADDDRSALWTTRATLATDASGSDLSVSLSIASIEFVARPFRYELFVPRVIREIARSGRATLGGRPITCTPRSVAVGNVTAFVEKDMCSPTRSLPIVVVSRANSSDVFPCDPVKLASDLCGLAEVWVLNDRWTTYGLSEAIGQRLSCFNGGVRTYWPGFAPSDDPFRHPLMTPLRLERLGSEGADVGRYLVRHLAPVGALRLTDSARSKRVRAATAEQRRTEAIASVHRNLAEGKVKELEDQILDAWDKADRLEKSLEAERERADEAEKQLDTVRQNFALVAFSASSAAEDGPAEDITSTTEVSTVTEAIDRARDDFPTLRIWSSAAVSARESRFARPEQVRQALEAIAEIGRLVFAQRKSKTPLGALDRLFEERGFHYAASDSQTTTTKYGKHRTFTDEGRKYLFEKHLTIGGGDKQNCLQIYFEFDNDLERVDIGYCGEHLPYERMRS